VVRQLRVWGDKAIAASLATTSQGFNGQPWVHEVGQLHVDK